MGEAAAMNKHTRQAALNQAEIGHLAATDATSPLTWPLPSPKVSRSYGFKLPSWLMSWLLVSPITAILTVFFALPTLLFLVVSFFDHDRVGIYPDFLLDSYRDLISNPATLRLYGSTLKFAAIVWAVTLFLGFNIAYFLVFHVRSSAVRITLFLLCTVPFLTSAIIRTIAWIPFLGRNGVFNQMLMDLRLTSQPLDFLLFSDFSVIVAYVYLYTILMIGPIANSLSKIDPSVLEAAHDAGASRWQTMTNIVIPLAKTGITLGSLLVITQVMGDYFVVRQMSGGQRASIVSALSTEIQAMQYPPAAANAIVLVAIVLVMVSLMMRVVDVRKELVK
jgi:putative spermidine/putrescine transport system permease protein